MEKIDGNIKTVERIAINKPIEKSKKEVMFDAMLAVLQKHEKEVDKGDQVTSLLALLNGVIAPAMPKKEFAPLLALQLLEGCANGLPIEKRGEYLRAVAGQLEAAASAVDGFLAAQPKE